MVPVVVDVVVVIVILYFFAAVCSCLKTIPFFVCLLPRPVRFVLGLQRHRQRGGAVEAKDGEIGGRTTMVFD